MMVDEAHVKDFRSVRRGDGRQYIVNVSDDEYENGTDPRDDDCDDDGLNDGEERDHGTGLLDHVTDDDGKRDGDEVRRGTDPLVADVTESQDDSASGGGSTGALLLVLLGLAAARRRVVNGWT